MFEGNGHKGSLGSIEENAVARAPTGDMIEIGGKRGGEDTTVIIYVGDGSAGGAVGQGTMKGGVISKGVNRI